jgi:hypothetical protein
LNTIEKRIKTLERAIKPLRAIVASLNLSKEEQETILKATNILKIAECQGMVRDGLLVDGTDEERRTLRDAVEIMMNRQRTTFREVQNE